MLAELCPDLAGWPKRWRFDDGDLDFGSRLLDVLTPFMRHLLTTNLSRKTLVRHRDHLWMLGGELVHALEAHLPPLDAFDRFPGSSALAMQRLG